MGKNIPTRSRSLIDISRDSLPHWLGFCAAAAITALAGQVHAACSPGNIGTEGPDQIICDESNDAEGADIDVLGGDDTVELNGGSIGSVFGRSGADTINIGGGGDNSSGDIGDAEDFDPDSIIGVTVTIENIIDAGSGNDTITLNNRLADVGNFLTGGGIDGGSGDDTIQLLDGLAFHVWGGDGNDTITLDGGFVFNYIDGGDGDDIIYWDEGLTDEVRGGNGSDRLTIDAFAFEGEAILDGGDDTSPNDGYIDTLTFILDYEMDGRLLRNWERIVIWGSSKTVFSGTLNVGGGLDGDGNDLGLNILFGGLVQFTPRHFVVTGNIANAGTLDLGNERYDSLTVAKDAAENFGDYIGRNGRLWLDVRLSADGSPADLLRIAGAASGRTSIRVTNRGGTGALTTGDGIKLVEVAGNSPADTFVLDGDFVAKDARPAVVGGAYAYTLHHNGRADPADGNWYLRSVVSAQEFLGPEEAPRWQPGAVMYETFPQLLRSLNIPSSLRSRVGNRFWMGSSYRDAEKYDYATAEERIIDGGGPWIRSSVRRLNVDPQESTTRTSWDQDYFQLQLGVDTALNFTVRGTQPVAGVALLYGDSENDLESFYGNGNIDVKGYGINGFMTWYGNRGEYLDAQLLLNWFEADITAFDLRDLAKSADAFGYAFSLEAGRSFRLHNLYSVTPQAQLIYSSEEADNIHDVYDVSVTDINNHGFLARFGATLEKRVSRRKSSRNMYGSLPLERFSFYITPSVIYNIDQETDVTVSGTRLYQDKDDWMGELSIGATYDECGDYCSIYGEIYYATSLENFGDSDGGGLALGFRYKW